MAKNIHLVAECTENNEVILRIEFIVVFRGINRAKLKTLYTNWRSGSEEAPRLLNEEELAQIKTFEIEIPASELDKLRQLYTSNGQEKIFDRGNVHFHGEQNKEFLCWASPIEQFKHVKNIIRSWLGLNLVQTKIGALDMNDANLDPGKLIKENGISIDVSVNK